MITDKVVKIIAARIEAAYELAMKEGSHREEVDPTRLTRLRVSAFPFCQIQWFLGLPNNAVKARHQSSSSRYFTRVGHVLHDTVQNALTNVGLEVHDLTLIGDWKCLSCKRMHTIRKKPSRCKRCGGSEFKYLEISLHSDVVTGHVDTVFSFRLKSGVPGYENQEFWIVIDYKTSSTYKTISTSSGIPYIGNVRQISGYVHALHESGYPVLPLAFLVYVPRDNPFRPRLEPVRVNLDDEARRLRIYTKRYVQIASAHKLSDLEKAVDTRPCRRELVDDFCECPNSARCAGPDNREGILEEMERIRQRMIKKLPILKESP